MDFKIPLPKEFSYVLSKYELRPETIGELLHVVIRRHTSEMQHMVDGYMKYDRGILADEIKLGEVEDDAVQVDKNGRTGSVYIYFQESYFDGCRDKNDHPNHEHEVPFTVDLDKNLVTMHFYDKPVRDPDEF